MLTYHAQRYTIQLQQLMFPGWLSNKASACQAGDAGDIEGRFFIIWATREAHAEA